MATEVFELMADPLLSAEKEPESKEESPLASHASSESENESNPSSLPPDVCIKCKKRPISYKKAHLCKSCYTNLPKYLERKKKYYNSDKARTKRRLQSALDTSNTEGNGESHSPRGGRRGNRAHMKVAMTLDKQPQHHTNPPTSVTGFQVPISSAQLDNMDRTSNHILIPHTVPARMVPSISPFHVPRAPDQTYLGHALQAYAQTVGTPRDYGMPYGMFRPPTNAASFDPMVVYKYENATNPSFIGSPHALATPGYVPQGNPAQIWQNADLAMIRPNAPKEKPTNGWQQQQNFFSPLFTEQYRTNLMNDGFFVSDLLDSQEIEMCNEELNRLGANNIDAYSKLWTGCWNTKAQFYIRTHPKLYSLLASCYGNYKLVSYPEFSIRLPGEIKAERESKSVCYAQSGIDYKQQFYKIAQGQPVDRRYTAIIALADQEHFGLHLLPGSQRAEFWVNWVRANAEELDKDKAGGCINITESRFKESEQLKSKFVPLPLKAGQVVIFDSFMAYGFTPASDAKTRNFVMVNLVECVDDKINAGELKNCEVFITNMSRLPPPVTFQHRAHSSEPSTSEGVCLTYLGHAMLGDTRLYNTAEGKKILERLQSAENLDSEIKQLTHAVLDEWARSRTVPGENNVNYNNNENNNEFLPRRISIQSVLNL